MQTCGLGVFIEGFEICILTLGGTGTEDNVTVASGFDFAEVQVDILPAGNVQSLSIDRTGTGLAACVATVIASLAVGDGTGTAAGGTAGATARNDQLTCL